MSFLSLFIPFTILVFADSTPKAVDLPLLRKFIATEAIQYNIDSLSRNSSFMSFDLENRPWSGSYWPARMGYIAYNYADTPYGTDIATPFPIHYSQFMNRRFESLNPATLNPDKINKLAPSEKYDLVMGILGKPESLTYQLWVQAKDISNRFNVTSWTGICHGWGPASMSLPRPIRSVEVPTQDLRHTVKFYPDDIKALASVLWANSYFETTMNPDSFDKGYMPMVFKRCDNRRPERDRDGHIIDPECDDTDPSFWHLAVINQLGGNKRSMIVDMSYSESISNHTLAGYSIKYFNPRTGKYGDLADSTEKRADFKKDILAKYRNPKTVEIVGVEMNVRYLKNSIPKAIDTDSPDRDIISDQNLLYDLELDADRNIISGQWRTDRRNRVHPIFGVRPRRGHPDFLWVVPANSLAWSRLDSNTNDAWNSTFLPVPDSWTKLASDLAITTRLDWDRPRVGGGFETTPSPQPLGKFVYQILDVAK